MENMPNIMLKVLYTKLFNSIISIMIAVVNKNFNFLCNKNRKDIEYKSHSTVMVKIIFKKFFKNSFLKQM